MRIELNKSLTIFAIYSSWLLVSNWLIVKLVKVSDDPQRVTCVRKEMWLVSWKREAKPFRKMAILWVARQANIWPSGLSESTWWEGVEWRWAVDVDLSRKFIDDRMRWSRSGQEMRDGWPVTWNRSNMKICSLWAGSCPAKAQWRGRLRSRSVRHWSLTTWLYILDDHDRPFVWGPMELPLTSAGDLTGAGLDGRAARISL